MSWISWLTLVGVAAYVLKMVWDIVAGVVRGEIDEAAIDVAIRNSIDGDTYDGSYGSRDGEVWCELCHRYHSA